MMLTQHGRNSSGVSHLATLQDPLRRINELAAALRLRLMPAAMTELDIVARRLIRASEGDLRRWIGVARLDNDLLGTLYLRVRELLEQGQEADDDDLAEDVTLTMYLTAAAWKMRDDPQLELLPALRQMLSSILANDRLMNANGGATTH